MISEPIPLENMFADFCVYRLLVNCGIEQGDYKKATPAALNGNDFVDYFKYFRKEVGLTENFDNYKENPLFSQFHEFVHKQMTAKFSNLQTYVDSDSTDSDGKMGSVVPESELNLQIIEVPAEAIDQVTEGAVRATLSFIKQGKITLDMLYPEYILLADKILAAIPDRLKIIEVSNFTVTRWSNQTLHINQVDMINIGGAPVVSGAQHMASKLVFNLVEQSVNYAVDQSLVKPEQVLAKAHTAMLPAVELQELNDFLDKFGSTESRSNLVKVLKSLVEAFTKPNNE
jgi:hypothetical protein